MAVEQFLVFVANGEPDDRAHVFLGIKELTNGIIRTLVQMYDMHVLVSRPVASSRLASTAAAALQNENSEKFSQMLRAPAAAATTSSATVDADAAETMLRKLAAFNSCMVDVIQRREIEINQRANSIAYKLDRVGVEMVTTSDGGAGEKTASKIDVPELKAFAHDVTAAFFALRSEAERLGAEFLEVGRLFIGSKRCWLSGFACRATDIHRARFASPLGTLDSQPKRVGRHKLDRPARRVHNAALGAKPEPRQRRAAASAKNADSSAARRLSHL